MPIHSALNRLFIVSPIATGKSAVQGLHPIRPTQLDAVGRQAGRPIPRMFRGWFPGHDRGITGGGGGIGRLRRNDLPRRVPRSPWRTSIARPARHQDGQ